MPKPLFLKPELLEESINETPLKFQQEEIGRIEKNLRQDIKTNKSLILAYLGPYGSGKSVTLNNVFKRLPKEYIKLQFDIWQCPDTENIWENFLIKLLSRIKQKNPDTISKIVAGKKIIWHRLILVSIISMLVYTLLWLLSETYKDNDFIMFLKDFSTSFLPIIVALTGISQIVPFYNTKIKNLHQYEKEIRHAIQKIKHPIVVIIEDVDRSGIAGRRFLETLKCFIRDIEKPLIIICPQESISFGETTYETSGDYNISAPRLNRSIKIYDDVLYSRMTSVLSNTQIKQFLDKVGCTDERLKKTILLLKNACIDHSVLTIRSLKFILRNTLSFIETNPELDPSLVFFFLSYKFVNGKRAGLASSLVKTLVEGNAKHTIDDNGRETKLLLHLFNINLNDYPNANNIIFEYSFLQNKDYDIVQICETEIICNINTKYEELLKMISAR